MGRATVSAFCGLVTLGSSSCSTEACDCPPAIVPAVVDGRVLDRTGAATPGALVRAYSAPETDCHSLDIDFGVAVAENDGGFCRELASGQLQDSAVCWSLLSLALSQQGWRIPTPNVLVMDFRDELTRDSARVELVLRAQ
jgi:hypothetical protein